MLAAFKARGLRRVFGVPGGDSSLDLIAAAGRQGIDFVLARGETAAAMMAAVTAELTGAPGVVLTGIGPGAASAVNGVAYAALERAPLVIVTDAREADTSGGGGGRAPPHQIFDQPALFAPIVKASRRLRPEDGAKVLEDLLDFALDEPKGPVHVDLSSDAAGTVVGTEAVGAAQPPRAAAAREGLTGDLAAVAKLLAASRRPAILAGTQTRAQGVAAPLRQFAEELRCPVLTSYKAKGVLADGHPRVIGHFTGARSEFEVLKGADLLIAVGLDPVEVIPAPWRAEAPLLALSRHPGPEFPVPPAARLQGPLTAGLARLAEAAAPSDWTQGEIAALRARLRAAVGLAGDGHTAETVIQAAVSAARAMVVGAGGGPWPRLTVDAGAHMFSPMALWPAGAPNDVLKSTGLSTMGFALPAAIASSLAEPARPVLAVTGDGGLLMCLAELSTAARLGCRLCVVAINDSALSLIDVKQQRQQRPPEGVRTPPVDFAAAARGLGCRAWSVAAGEPLEPALRAAFATAFAGDGPTLVDVTTDASGYGAQLAALRGG
jgi:acetolactate synthase-1/2/3 large subunit